MREFNTYSRVSRDRVCSRQGSVHVSGPEDLDRISETIANAFYDHPFPGGFVKFAETTNEKCGSTINHGDGRRRTRVERWGRCRSTLAGADSEERE